MGIQKIGPNLFHIKARVIVPSLDPRKPRDDRRRQETFEGSKAAAEARYLEIRNELRGVPKAKEVRTFGHILEVYREFRGAIPAGERATFAALYRDLGNSPVTPLEALELALARYFNIARTLRSQVDGEPLSNGTINHLRTMANAALNLAVARKLLDKNPLTKAIWPKLRTVPRDRMLTPEEDTRLREVIAEHAAYILPIYRFAYLVPCRRSELEGMTRADLDLFNNAIRVKNGTTKNDEGIWKPIPEELIPYFRSLPPGCNFLFWRPGKGKKVGQYLRLGDFKKAWKRVRELAGVRDFTFHDTRHISATNMVNAGTPERVVMKVAGWSTNMLDTYWGSIGQEHLGLVKFPGGSGNKVATSEAQDGEKGDFSGEKAVSA